MNTPRVTTVSEKSDFCELTWFLFSSFQEKERKKVEDILIKRENALKDEIKKERRFVDMEKKKVEEYKDRCGVLENEVKKVRESYENEVGKMKEHCGVVEKEACLKQMVFVDEVKRIRENYEKQLGKMKERRGIVEKEGYLKQKVFVDEVKKLRGSYEVELKRMNDHCRIVDKEGYLNEVKKLKEDFENEGCLKQKVLEDKVRKMREKYEEELKKERGLVVEEKKKVEKLTKSRMEFEVKMNEHCGVLVKDGYLEKKVLEDELKNLEKELEKMKERYDVLEKEGRLKEKVLEDEVKRLKESDSMKFADRIEVLERKNSDLNKELELYKERFCYIGDFVEQIKVIYHSTVNGNVWASGGLSMCKSREREKRRCSVFEDEFEDGGYNDNNLRCKRRRMIDGSKGDKDTPVVEENKERALVCYNRPLLNDLSRELDAVDGVFHCSAHYRVDSRVDLSENKEVAGFQTSKETTWSGSADMVSAFKNDPELCMAAVCTLYRQHISAGNPSTRGVIRGVDIHSTADMAKYLVKNDAENKLSRSVLEVQRDWPHGPYVLQTCERLAIRYKEQLFEIYQKKLDPFFCTRS